MQWRQMYCHKKCNAMPPSQRPFGTAKCVSERTLSTYPTSKYFCIFGASAGIGLTCFDMHWWRRRRRDRDQKSRQSQSSKGREGGCASSATFFCHDALQEKKNFFCRGWYVIQPWWKNWCFFTGILSQIRTKLSDWAAWQAGAGCYSQDALSSNESKTL